MVTPNNTKNYEEPLLCTNEHAMAFNNLDKIDNTESSAIKNVSDGNAGSPIQYNSSSTKTGIKIRLNKANWKANVVKRLRYSGKPYKSLK